MWILKIGLKFPKGIPSIAIAFDPSGLAVEHPSKTGYILATNKSNSETFEVDFDHWKDDLSSVLSPTAIHSKSYLNAPAFA